MYHTVKAAWKEGFCFHLEGCFVPCFCETVKEWVQGPYRFLYKLRKHSGEKFCAKKAPAWLIFVFSFNVLPKNKQQQQQKQVLKRCVIKQDIQ